MGSITVVVCLVGLQIGQAQWADHHHAHNDHEGADHAESSRGDHKDHDQPDGHVTKEDDRHDDAHGKGSNEKVEEVVVEDYHDNGHHSRRINDHPSRKVYSPLPYGYGYNFHGARYGYADSGHYGYPHYGYGYEPYGYHHAHKYGGENYGYLHKYGGENYGLEKHMYAHDARHMVKHVPVYVEDKHVVYRQDGHMMKPHGHNDYGYNHGHDYNHGYEYMPKYVEKPVYVEAKHRVKPVVKPKSETILKPIYKAEPLKKQVVLEEKVVKPHAYGVHKVVDHKYKPMHVQKPLYEKKYVHDNEPSYEGKYGYGHGYDHGYDHGYEHHRHELKPGYDHGYDHDYPYKHKPVVKYGYYY